jgi:hypothetical protein
MAKEDGFRILTAGEIGSFRCRTPVLERLLAYWDLKRAGRPWPLRADIDPADIKPLLPNIMLVDIMRQPFRVRYRLVGTEIAHVAHFDFTGHFLDQLTFEGGDSMDWAGCYRQVTETGRPGFGTVHWLSPVAAHRWVEFLICPLSTDGASVTQCISGEDYEPLKPSEFDSLDHASSRR